jgi:hypothetical protein
MSDYAELMNLEKKKKQQPVRVLPAQLPTPEEKPVAPPPVSEIQASQEERVSSQSTSQSTRQSVNQPADRRADKTDVQIVDRPKSFYITNRLDQRLNSAVQYLQERHGIKKVDRSVLLNAKLDTDEQWTHEALDQLVSPILSILTSRLIK